VRHWPKIDIAQPLTDAFLQGGARPK